MRASRDTNNLHHCWEMNSNLLFQAVVPSKKIAVTGSRTRADMVELRVFWEDNDTEAYPEFRLLVTIQNLPRGSFIPNSLIPRTYYRDTTFSTYPKTLQANYVAGK